MDGFEESQWSKKKIAIGVIILGLVLFVGYQNRERILSYNKQPIRAVAGVETVVKQESNKTVVLPSFDIQEKIETITQQVSNLDVSEVAASSPQIQKVLKDMESLKNIPQDQAKDACLNICRSL
ncbi:MAG: hypothetical protein KBD46_01060 [Candidatus Levybacteria bacterium]|nr:hypothetical protein [Candidatus Levybacteria bacterium]